MEKVTIKHKEFEVVDRKGDHSFVAKFKDKLYFVNCYTPKSDEFKGAIDAVKKIKLSGVASPKLCLIDKKQGYIVREYIEGEYVSDVLAKEDLKESVYEQLFKNAYYAKINKMTLNYEPDKWMICNDKLVYVFPLYIIYKKEKDLVERYLRLWFMSEELNNFLKEKGIELDKMRIKKEAETNKEIILMTCKYYK